MKWLSALLSGVLFGLGLAWSGMTNPFKVLNFLDVTGAWDPTLLLVMAGAMLTYAVGYRLIVRRTRPWLEPGFHLPTRHDVDRRLIVGAAVFGVGWGLGGYCPGPVLANLGLANPDLWWLLPALLLGWWIAGRMRQTT